MKSIGKHDKPSTAIAIFEKVVEPILTYNCEVTQAYVPIKWDFSKFQQNILKLNKQLNMVVISFLRQILGVHKKTMNAAIMAETGKLPISLKIFTSIFKYWIRTFTCESDLVRQAILCNRTWDKRGQSWIRIIHFLLHLTNLQGIRPTDDEKSNKKFVITFKKRLILVLKYIFQSEITNSPKLDYYKKYKKVVQFEKYLDNVPRYLRIHASRLRLSCHNLPIETLRYGKKKVERKNRICKLCTHNEIGDEDHYLLKCSAFTDIRRAFIQDVKVSLPDFEHFSTEDIIKYCMLLHDERIQIPFAKYIRDILDGYREIVEDSGQDPHKIVQTRSGRIIKKPQKLNL